MFNNLIATFTPLPDRDGRRVRIDRNKRGFTFRVAFGPGAGRVRWSDDRTRVLVTGRTLFVAWHSDSRRWARRHRPGSMAAAGRIPLEIGITRNANRVPYMSGG